MAKYTRKEIQELTDATSQTISVYVKRESLTPIWIGEKMYFDDKDPKNAKFIRNRLNKKKKEVVVSKNNENILPEIKELPKKETKKYKAAVFENGIQVPTEKQKKIPFEQMDVLQQKEVLQVEKLQEEIAIKKIQKEKQQGLVIPTDIVINLFSTTFKSFINEFYAAAEDLGNTTVYSLGGKREDVVKFRARLIESINKSSEKGTNAALKNIDGIVEEYSEKRGKGESK